MQVLADAFAICVHATEQQVGTAQPIQPALHQRHTSAAADCSKTLQLPFTSMSKGHASVPCSPRPVGCCQGPHSARSRWLETQRAAMSTTSCDHLAVGSVCCAAICSAAVGMLSKVPASGSGFGCSPSAPPAAPSISCCPSSCTAAIHPEFTGRLKARLGHRDQD